MRHRLFAVLCSVCAMACGDGTGPPPEPPTLKNVIVFTSDRDGGAQLHRMNPDGTDVRLILTTVTGLAVTPAVSPDGRLIAFSVNGDIHVVNADGSGETALTQTGAYEDHPSWSPDGNRLTFMSDRDGNREIYVMNADGTQQRDITADPGDDEAPSWSPDGTAIAFMSNRTGAFNIWVAAPGGGAAIALTSGQGIDVGPAWSPDGSQIAFGSTRNGIGNALFVMNADGTNARELATPGRNVGTGQWAPDGTHIATVCDPAHVCVINADGTGLVDLSIVSPSPRPPVDLSPTWSP